MRIWPTHMIFSPTQMKFSPTLMKFPPRHMKIWQTTQSRLASCPRMLYWWISRQCEGSNTQPWDYNFNTDHCASKTPKYKHIPHWLFTKKKDFKWHIKIPIQDQYQYRRLDHLCITLYQVCWILFWNKGQNLADKIASQNLHLIFVYGSQSLFL